MPSVSQNWLDRALGFLAPRVQLQRVRARVATDVVVRHYEAASTGRRTSGWVRQGSDANTAQAGATLAKVRDAARDLVRNNPYAEAALSTIVDHAIGSGIVAKMKGGGTENRWFQMWKAWADSTQCDADGRHDFYGLQKLIIRSVAESGEVLVRRRRRRLTDGVTIPLQLQVLEADFLDSARTTPLGNGGQIIQGVEFDQLGNRVAYWLFPRHPGALSFSTMTAALFPASQRIPATDILHIYQAARPGQVRGASWFANSLVRFKDFDEFEDATLMKQKIAACLAVITSDVDGTGAPLGTADDSTNPGIDTLQPGAILNVPPGRSVEVVQPPSVGEYQAYTSVTLRAIAAGIGVTYEDITTDYTNMSFSAARMSRLRHWDHVEDWRWRLIVPQFCDPVWNWALEAAGILGMQPIDDPTPDVRWTAPPMPMIELDKEALAYLRAVRSGLMTLSEAIRERGYDPDEVFAEIKAD